MGDTELCQTVPGVGVPQPDGSGERQFAPSDEPRGNGWHHAGDSDPPGFSHSPGDPPWGQIPFVASKSRLCSLTAVVTNQIIIQEKYMIFKNFPFETIFFFSWCYIGQRGEGEDGPIPPPAFTLLYGFTAVPSF